MKKTDLTEKNRPPKRSADGSPAAENSTGGKSPRMAETVGKSGESISASHIRIHAALDRIAVTNGLGDLVCWDAISGVGVADDVIDISLGRLGSLAVLRGGRAAAFGVNFDRHCLITDFPDIVSASAGTGYGCLVTSDGKLKTVGSMLFPEADAIDGVRTALTGEGFIMLLLHGGRAMIIPENARESARFPIKKFDRITGAAASDIAVLLDEDGTPHIGGCRVDDDRLDALDWSGIKAVAADFSFIYGITPDGSVLTAGDAAECYDRGRSRVSEWKNVIAISCGSGFAAALTKSGELLTAGILSPMTSKDRRQFETLVRDMITTDGNCRD